MSTDEIQKVEVKEPFISRRERRAGTPKEPRTDIVVRADRNNRKSTKARKNNKLFLKLAAFEMWRMDKIMTRK